MRAHDLLAPNRMRPAAPSRRPSDGTIRTERVDEMWGTDLTSTMTGEEAGLDLRHGRSLLDGNASAFHAARRATRFEALEPLRQGVRTALRQPSPGASLAA